MFSPVLHFCSWLLLFVRLPELSSSHLDDRPLYWVLTAPHLIERSKEVLQTWGKGAPQGGLLFAGAEPKLKSIAGKQKISTVGVSPDLANPGLRELAVWRYVHDRFPTRRWYVKADDDTFFILSNLEQYLSTFNSSKAYFLGRRFLSPDTNYTTWTVSGGAGYVLSWKALALLRKSLRTCATWIYEGRPGWTAGGGDTAVALCLLHVGIKPADTRDEQQRHRFHIFPYSVHVSGQFGLERSWYWAVSEKPMREGVDCCGDATSVSFHYMSRRMRSFSWPPLHAKNASFPAPQCMVHPCVRNEFGVDLKAIK